VGKLVTYNIKIEWDGPFNVAKVIREMDRGGQSPDWDGEDYGLYQIYGKHILCGKDTLLYIGQTTDQTFSRRFKQHEKDWLKNEDMIKVYLGRVYYFKRHSKKDNWESWKQDIEIAEKILIYKYSPNYNNRNIGEPPNLWFKNVRLVHKGKRHKLKLKDNAPKDYQEG
jgi:hypothetical protein